MIWHSLRKRVFHLAVLLMVLAVPALAQVQSGSIQGTVLSSDDKSPLPGVTVTLTGGGAPLIQTTDAPGQAPLPGPFARYLQPQIGDRGLLGARVTLR